MKPTFSRSTPLCLLPACACLLAWSGRLSYAQSVPAQAKKAANAAGKTISKAVAKATNTGRRTGRKVTATAGRVARVTTAAAGKMLATPEWEKLRSAYDYDASAPKRERRNVLQGGLDSHQAVVYRTGRQAGCGHVYAAQSGRNLSLRLLPHGLTNNKEIAIKMFGGAFACQRHRHSRPDAPNMGRAIPQQKLLEPESNYRCRHEGGAITAAALDYLATRTDIDMEHIGLLGYSMGSITGSIIGAVDERIGAFALCVGGDPFLPIAHATPDDAIRQAELQVCPSLYIGHISGKPIIMFNGLTDVVVVPPAAKLLQVAAPQPKEVVWYNGGHDVPDAIRARAVDWLAGKLKGGEAPAPEDKSKPADTSGDKPNNAPKKQADPPK